ncbi:MULTISPECIES: GpE family phage tail protein [Brenneria]|uniref:GpE family phage tail protein n=1 Tax=Brenneria nigrifluens DSM 30175 = ATCC 13028 TaxID=1121120 RepID=A0A2U1UBM0_9GAMM|nr:MULTISPECIES: GpE family phage tail protein [Brenneria]PWC19069.1 GpE family phage tail protein [Brenneria nigrifluens DSM 30175 = ATCC 13028]QCR06896.1 GpE family phage tail protein [Brenneria nigrifluens DSM 30175 = ATCC 13028]
MDGWRELAADVTFYFHWEPNAAWGMSLTRLEWWATQARRIKNLKANKNG